MDKNLNKLTLISLASDSGSRSEVNITLSLHGFFKPLTASNKLKLLNWSTT